MELKYFVWTESFRLKAFEVDTDGFALISVIANYMQEAAGSHAERFGLSMQSLLDQNMGWILNRFTVHVHRYPKAGEVIRIETWPMGADRIFAYRDFELFDEKGELVLSARTAWLILDIIKRRPISTPENVKALGAKNKRFADIDVPSRLPKVEGLPVKEIDFAVRRSDLDINRHVNNVKYLEWVLETLGDNEHTVRPKGFDIQFKAESVYGDVNTAEKYTNENGQSLHRVVRKEDEKELSLAVISI
jgi:medium-chain acyl-[acyl-carrier-protein] hydrolase